ncbi:MAG: DevR family CRISPR-associated autoregulator [Caldilineaceae bacterium]|nr:DevR family CRISPR-associated autoregulator [Caldilineaceae bacterium]MDE0338434.1 DevR family CRISPR-associated autoregulator [Caldilineaceae bacterium]
MTTIFNLSIAAKATLNLHSLNNEGGEGNQTQTRMVNIVGQDNRLHSVNAISGDMLKHIQAEHLYRISKERGLPLCAACQRFDANRMSGDPEFDDWVKKEKPTPVQVVDRLLTCTLDDIEGNLITAGNLSVPRKSVVEFGWAVGIPELVTTDQYFHVKYDPDRREIPTEKVERSGNLGQAIFHRPANSGQYAIVCNIEAHRIGYNDISQKVVLEGGERQARLAALLESLLYSFVQPTGAMRNTQNPHIVDVTGTLTYSTGAAPAPMVSPLNPNFIGQTKDISASLNRIHDGRVHVEEYKSLSSLADVMQGLLTECQPHEFAR